jgi:hypothetical protein
MSFRYLLKILEELGVNLFAVKALQVLLAVGEHRFDVDLVLQCEIQRARPAEEVEVQLDGAVHERGCGLQQDAFSLFGVAAEQRKLRLSTFLGRNSLDRLNVLNLWRPTAISGY